MTDALFAFHRRGPGESAPEFGHRLRDAASASLADAATAVLLVDDGASGAPPEAAVLPSQFDGGVLVAGVSLEALPAPDAAYAVQRRILKARVRGSGGARSDGFTVIIPSVRLPSLTHREFDAYWRADHAQLHLSSSPATAHYEQLAIDAALTPGGPAWDGISLISVESALDYTERFFDGERGREAIFADIARFVDLEKGEMLLTSEYVYSDQP